MHYRLKVEKPEAIEFTLTATMTAKEWEQLREQLDKLPMTYPANRMVSAITDMLAQARKIYWPRSPETEGDRQA